MKKKHLLSLAGVLFAGCLLMITSCASLYPPNLKMPESFPPGIKAYKHVTLYGGYAGMQNTGVYVNKGDVYSVFASGEINRCPGKGCPHQVVRPEMGWPFLIRFGEKGYAFYPLHLTNAFSTVSYSSGQIYIGYYSGGKPNVHGEPPHPEWYRDDTGAFSVDIIIWEGEDWIQISDFFEMMKQKDPDNQAVVDALAQAENLKSIYVASEKTSKELEETKKALQELKEKPAKEKETSIKAAEKERSRTQTRPTIADEKKQERVAQLETRLAELKETLAQLEEMKKKLEEERKKTGLLTEQLAEKERREKNLLIKLEDGSKTPPVIVIASPKDESKTEANTIHLSGVVEDEKGVKGIEIFVNRKPIEPRSQRGIKIAASGPPKRLDLSEKIRLDKGMNQIKVRVVDEDGLVTEKDLTIHHMERRKNVWAVVIGINDYSHIPKLKYAVNDATLFHHYLINYNHIPPENVTLLLDQEASLVRVRSTLGTRLKNKAGKDDMVIIFFAGHGATEKDAMSPDGDGLEKYLLPYNADPKDLYATAIPMEEISRIFKRIRSDRLVFIADSCYSGASGGRTIGITGIRTNISEAFLERIAGGKGRVIMSASGANEVSAENDDLKQGVFTHYMVEGLKGKADFDDDGLITVDEVYRYVSEEVPRATGQEQHPVKKGTVEGRLVLGVVE